MEAAVRTGNDTLAADTLERPEAFDRLAIVLLCRLTIADERLTTRENAPAPVGLVGVDAVS